MVEPMAEPDCLQLRSGAWLRFLLSRQFHRRGHVFLRGHGRQEVKGLQHDPDPPAPRMGQRILVHADEILTRDLKRTPARAFETGQDSHQRALARSGRAEQRHRFARHHVEIDAAQDFNRRFRGSKSEGEIAGGDRSLRIGHIAAMAQGAVRHKEPRRCISSVCRSFRC
jgi:hypothetical protein